MAAVGLAYQTMTNDKVMERFNPSPAELRKLDLGRFF